MQSEMARFRADVAADPSIVAACMSDDFSVDDLVAGARNYGYDFSVEDLDVYYTSDKGGLATAKSASYSLLDSTGQTRDLTPDEAFLVGGGEYVYTSTYSSAFTYIAVSVYTIAVVATAAFSFASATHVVTVVSYVG